MEKEYNIGLDIGNASVGWSVVDNDYNILKFKKKNMWGARLFDVGQTAEKRRSYRNSRRRIQRRRERIALLKMCIGPMVLEKEEQFFLRLEKGCLNKEEKGYLYNLFDDENYTDGKYYEDFKTIYHLRKYLCTTDEKADPRFIYLALHHIMKYRGNFLYEGQTFDMSKNDQNKENMTQIIEGLFDEYEDIKVNAESIVEKILEQVNNSKLSLRDKEDNINKIFLDIDASSKKIVAEMTKLLIGKMANITKLFPNSCICKDDKDYKFSFKSSDYDSEIEFIEESLQEDFECFSLLHNMYSFITLQEILSGHDTVYDAMIEKYEKHKEDIKEFKAFIKSHGDLDLYKTIFRSEKVKGNYYAYINNKKDTTNIEFYAFLKKIFQDNECLRNTDFYQKMLQDIENERFLPKQNTKSNGAIPYQLHEIELKQIIDNQGKHYPILLEQKDKLITLFKFRIPYYVGPLNVSSDKAWISRNLNVKLTPWNFEQEVDLLESAEKFIRKMTNCCSYLISEQVIPKNSLLYTKYEVLNELNKMRVNGKLVDVDVKNQIFEEVFMSKNKVKKNDIEAFYKRKQLCDVDAELDITGFQKENEFASSLNPWREFKDIYGNDFEQSLEEIETLIEWISVYEDKKILKKRIKEEFPEIAKNELKLKRIVKLKYRGWGRLSRKLLTELRVKDAFDNYVSIMDCLESSTMNFMQIINDKKLGFKDLIEEYSLNDIKDSETKYDQIAKLQGSPALKKGIWQAVQVVDELVDTMGCLPKQIYIEFSREDDEKKRTISRIKKLKDIYATQKKEHYADAAFLKAYEELKKFDDKEAVNDERIILYLLQQGKCMYSGKPLDITNLKLYQIDHIIPQSFIKDNSIDNKVLVISAKNQDKGYKQLISKDIIYKQRDWWKMLLDKKLIGEKKYKNLTKEYITERDEIGFINRQLVETRQIIKHVANLLKVKYPDTNIVSIKANLSSEFRKKFNLYKVREMNDFHHAQDAYIACVIGTFVMKRYPSLRKEFIFTEYNQMKNFANDIEKMNQTKSKYGFILNSMNDSMIFDSDTGEVLWEGTNSIQKVKNVFNYKDCYVTRKVEEKKGQLYNLTIKKNDDLKTTIMTKPHKVIPVNKQRNDITKYGGFTTIEKAYGIAIEYKIGKNVKREVLDVPILLANEPQDKIIEYLKKETESTDIKIIKDKILYNQLFEYNGGLYTMASASEWSNAKQLILSEKSQKTLYYLFNKQTFNISDSDITEVYDEYLEKIKLHYPLLGGIYTKLKDNKEAFDGLNSLEDKAKVLKELLKATKASPSFAVLNDQNFKISSSAGRINGKKTYLDETIFIFQSVTGLFEQKRKL